MSDCIFCRIQRGEIPAQLLHQDERLVAFRDIAPQAPTHVLVIPREHIPTLNDLDPRHAALVGEMHLLAAELARSEGIAEQGYRVLFNCGRDGGQAVYHIHLHLLGGRRLDWPPG